VGNDKLQVRPTPHHHLLTLQMCRLRLHGDARSEGRDVELAREGPTASRLCRPRSAGPLAEQADTGTQDERTCSFSISQRPSRRGHSAVSPNPVADATHTRQRSRGNPDYRRDEASQEAKGWVLESVRRVGADHSSEEEADIHAPLRATTTLEMPAVLLGRGSNLVAMHRPAAGRRGPAWLISASPRPSTVVVHAPATEWF